MALCKVGVFGIFNNYGRCFYGGLFKKPFMKHGSLFSGIGGFDLAAQWMGWENIFHCEKANYQRSILEKKFPEARSIKDVHDIYRFTNEMKDLYGDGDVMWCERHDMDFSDCECIGCSEWEAEMSEIDILTAGFPCQPFSNNGKRQGTNDERNLWPETIRVIQRLYPRWFVGENVPGIISWNNGRYFSEIQNDLKKEGYEVWSFLIPATTVGAEHQRERVWIVAYNKSIRMERLRAEGKQIAHPLDQQVLPLRNSNGEWQVEPDVRRTYDGISSRMDRLQSLGNAIVPQVAFQIFKTIHAYEIILMRNE